MASRRPQFTSTTHGAKEVLSVPVDPLDAVKVRVEVMHSRVHGAQKATRRYQRRQGKVEMRQRLRGRDWD